MSEQGEAREGERGEAVQQSRRTRGLPPEEQKSLDEVQKEARKAKAAKKKAARRAKESTPVPDPPAPEPDNQDAHQAVLDEGSSAGISQELTSGSGEGLVSTARPDEGESTLDEPVPMSEGGVTEVEPPDVDGVSDSPQPDEDVATAEDSPTIEQEGPLTTVQDEVILEEKADVPAVSPVPVQADSTDSVQTLPVPPQVDAKASSSETASRDTGRSLPPIKMKAFGFHSDALSEAQVKAYVADQVRWWEQVRSEMVAPLKVRYAWTSPGPDFQLWWTATLATSEYLRERVSPSSRDGGWTEELQLTRAELCLAREGMAIGVPPSLLTSRECVALIQTLLFQSGFRFRNLIPMWFQSRTSRVASQVRMVVEDLQHFLALELVEWHQVVCGVPAEVVLTDDTSERGALDEPPVLEYRAEDSDHDLMMTDYEAGLLGREYVLRLRLSGVRRQMSPQGSTNSEPGAKRTQHAPPRPVSTSAPSLSSLPSYSLQDDTVPSVSSLTERASTTRASSSRVASSISSLFGTSGDSDESMFSVAQGSRSSRESSASSSMWSNGQSASVHMPTMSYGSMVMAARAGYMQTGGDFGVQITRNVPLPPAASTDQVDADMPELTRDVSSSGRRSRNSSRHTGSSLPRSDDCASRGHRSVSSRERSPSRREYATSRSSRSERSSRSSRSGSVMSGASQVALNSMRQTREVLHRMEMKQKASATQLGAGLQSVFQAIQKIAEQYATRKVQAVSQNKVHPVMPHRPHPVLADPFAEQREAEVLRVAMASAFEQQWMQRQAEEEARRVQFTQDVKRERDAQLELMQQQMRALELERAQEREAAANVQRFHASQLRDLRAAQTTAPVKQEPVRMTLHPKPDGVIPSNKATENADELLAAQLQATLDGVNLARAKENATTKVSPAQAAATTTKQEASSRTSKPTSSRATPTKETGEPKSEGKKTPPYKKPLKKPSGRGGGPPDSDPESGHGDDGDSDDSDSSMDDVPTVQGATTADGSPTWPLRPYVSASALNDFDEKTPIQDRIRWWEKFLTVSIQGGWTNQMKVYELRPKLSESVRNWRYQLPKHIRRDWTRFSKAFKAKYCKSKVSNSERYYTISQRKHETPLEFFYRLNAAAGKADVTIAGSVRSREQHIKRFVRKLAKSDIKTSLTSQLFCSVDDLEAVLIQHEEKWEDDDRDRPTPRQRDFRADSLCQGRFRPRPVGPTGRAYVTQSDPETDDEGRQVRFLDEAKQGARARAHFQAMQAGDEHPRA